MGPSLLDRARRGDQDALADLLALHVPRIRSELEANIPRRLQASLSADDVVQVTCTDAFLGIAKASAPDDQAFAAWLLRAARNNLHDAIRRLDAEKRGGKARRLNPTARTDARTFVERLFGADTDTPSRIAMRGESESALERALQALPVDYRSAVRLYDLDGQPIELVARELGRSPGAVHLLRVRAHKRLRELLARAGSSFT